MRKTYSKSGKVSMMKPKKKKIKTCSKCQKKLTQKDIYRSSDEWAIQPLQREQIEGAAIRVISGKGGKDRIVPKPKAMTESAIKRLPLKIKRRALQHFVTELGRKVLDKEISFHTLRHGFATTSLEKGFQLHEVQMLMGHSRLDTTGIYLHASPDKILKKYEEVF